MAKISSLIGALALLAVSQAAFAFEEQKSGQPGGAAAQSQPSLASPPGGGVQLGGDRVMPSSSGTVISVPGLGKIGVLPKMDLGLELLYSATDGKAPPAATRDEDGVTIRGSIKHAW